MPLSILDTCAIVHLANTRLRDRTALAILSQAFDDVCVPDKVHDELRSIIQINPDEFVRNANEVFSRECHVSGTIRICEVSSECLKAVIRSEMAAVTHLQKTSKIYKPKKHLDIGEKEATALALQLSRQKDQYISLITGDFKAIPLLEFVFCDQSIGHVYSTPDLFTYLFERCYITKEEAWSSITNLVSDIIPGYGTYSEVDFIISSRNLPYVDKLERVYKPL